MNKKSMRAYDAYREGKISLTEWQRLVKQVGLKNAKDLSVSVSTTTVAAPKKSQPKKEVTHSGDI